MELRLLPAGAVVVVTAVERTAQALWRQALHEEQAARTIPDDREAVAVRKRVRELARAAGVGVRTARLGATVVVVRVDAAVWHESAATMRRKLAPHD